MELAPDHPPGQAPPAPAREVDTWPYLVVLAVSVLMVGALLTADFGHPAAGVALGALPALAVLGAGAVAYLVGGRSEAQTHAAGHVAVACGVAVLTVVALASRELAGPAMLVSAGFALLAWFRRDALLGAAAIAAIVATAPLDSLGPAPFDAGDAGLRLASFGVVAGALLAVAGLSRWRSRRGARS